MVFQDGHMYLDPEGEIRAAVVFDNLIHRVEMPVTIGVFVDPGEPENRNAEYDTFSDVYATFLLTEILPNVQDRYLVTDDPDRWAIGGGSSGGSCAFTVGWTRPDRFRRVLCFSGSFAQIRGGNPYLELIEHTPEEAAADLPPGSDSRSQLGRSGVQLVRHELADGCCTGGTGVRRPFRARRRRPQLELLRRFLPDALRWLWRRESE